MSQTQAGRPSDAELLWRGLLPPAWPLACAPAWKRAGEQLAAARESPSAPSAHGASAGGAGPG